MSDFDDQMAEWRKTVWGTGPCPVPSQENFTLTDEEREAIETAIATLDAYHYPTLPAAAATLLKMLERLK